MTEDCLDYVTEAICKTLVDKEFEDVRDKKQYRFMGMRLTEPIIFDFGDTHDQVFSRSYSFFELKNLREVEQSQLEQATQSREGEK